MPKKIKTRVPSRLDQFVQALGDLQRHYGFVLDTDWDDAGFSPDPAVKVYESTGSATDNPIYRATISLDRNSSRPYIVYRRAGKLPKGVQR